MKKQYLFMALGLLLMACKPVEPTPTPNPGENPGDTTPVIIPDPEGTIYYTETDELFTNPERGFYIQTYYESDSLGKVCTLASVQSAREKSQISLFLHSYYMKDYIASDIPQEYMKRFDQNMNTLREGGAKAILRFSYKHTNGVKAKPWDATPEWAMRHIEQLEPYLKKHADVIYCVQAGFIGVWGEWYYTTNYPQNPSEDEGYATRWPVAERLMTAVPADRQICFRQPQFKMRYLRSHGMEVAPLTAEEAYQPTIKARWAGHNDCFVSSNSDVGTYHNDEEREFWAQDTKYTLMGGETCGECEYSGGENAIHEMEKYHWSYLCNSYHPDVLGSWAVSGHLPVIKRRLGYRFALDKALLTQAPKAGEAFQAEITLHNSGFAAPANKRDVELIFVSTTNPEEKYIYPQTEDPRFWMAGEKRVINLGCTLDAKMKGEYKLYLNLPDPYESLHNDPRYSIRLANENMWDEATGYNYLTTVTVE